MVYNPPQKNNLQASFRSSTTFGGLKTIKKILGKCIERKTFYIPYRDLKTNIKKKKKNIKLTHH